MLQHYRILLGYWQSKYKKNGYTAVFSANEPTIKRVGHLIPLQCGHNGKLERLEVAILSVHLETAGFLETEEIDIYRKGSIDDVPVSPRKPD